MSLLDRLFAAGLPVVPKPVVRRLSRRYIAGENREDAVAVARRMAQAGYRITYDVLGEAVTDRAGTAEAVKEYHALQDAVLAAGLEPNLSLKPTHMGLEVDEELCFQEVCAAAKRLKGTGGFLRFEMEDSSTTDGTLRVFARLRERFGGGIGCVLQSMLHRTEDDARRLLDAGGPLNVRLVKGVYLEPAEIAWQEPEEISAAYLRLLRMLLAGGASVAVATHDDAMVEGLRAVLREIPEARERCEVQMLLGVRENLRHRVHGEGLPVRVYIPYGKDWHAYVLRRLRQNPKLAGYAFRGLFRRRERLKTA